LARKGRILGGNHVFRDLLPDIVWSYQIMSGLIWTMFDL
jgi:hypothetical protein